MYLIAVGSRMPAWVISGYQEYAQRLTQECVLQLIEIAPAKRAKTADTAKILREESERIRAAIPKGSLVVVLDERGQELSTRELSDELSRWLSSGCDIALIAGGADGLAADCKSLADKQWSLSRLTLPHPLVRVLVAEQLYRAWTLLHNHPYHRA